MMMMMVRGKNRHFELAVLFFLLCCLLWYIVSGFFCCRLSSLCFHVGSQVMYATIYITQRSAAMGTGLAVGAIYAEKYLLYFLGIAVAVERKKMNY